MTTVVFRTAEFYPYSPIILIWSILTARFRPKSLYELPPHNRKSVHIATEPTAGFVNDPRTIQHDPRIIEFPPLTDLIGRALVAKNPHKFCKGLETSVTPASEKVYPKSVYCR